MQGDDASRAVLKKGARAAEREQRSHTYVANRFCCEDDARRGDLGDRLRVGAADAASNERPQKRGATRAERVKVLVQPRLRRLLAENRTDVMEVDDVIVALAFEAREPLRKHAKEALAELGILRDVPELLQHPFQLRLCRCDLVDVLCRVVEGFR